MSRQSLTSVAATQPFLARAEQEKLDYEAARRAYERDSTSYGTSINFSILPRSEFTFLPSSPIKGEPMSSESDSEGGFATDEGNDNLIQSS
jgi:hypothetical protein